MKDQSVPDTTATFLENVVCIQDELNSKSQQLYRRLISLNEKLRPLPQGELKAAGNEAKDENGMCARVEVNLRKSEDLLKNISIEIERLEEII